MPLADHITFPPGSSFIRNPRSLGKLSAPGVTGALLPKSERTTFPAGVIAIYRGIAPAGTVKEVEERIFPLPASIWTIDPAPAAVNPPGVTFNASTGKGTVTVH